MYAGFWRNSKGNQFRRASVVVAISLTTATEGCYIIRPCVVYIRSVRGFESKQYNAIIRASFVHSRRECLVAPRL